MGSKPQVQREVRPERRRHPRAESTLQYRRLRMEIDLPPALATAWGQLLNSIGLVRSRVRLWRYRNRRVVF